MSNLLKQAPKRSAQDIIIGGVCAGIAETLDIDPFWTRLTAVVLIPFTGGAIILIYIALWVIMDKAEPTKP